MVEHDKRTSEPTELADARRAYLRARRTDGGTANPWKAYVDQACKQAIRQALVEDQRWLCAYCGCRIEPTPTGMKVEHRLPRAASVDGHLDWQNLLGVCPDANRPHCDSERTPYDAGPPASGLLHHHPAQHPVSILFRYDRQGRVWPCKEDDRLQQDLDQLQLNLPSLVRERSRVLQDFRNQLRRLQDGHRSRKLLQRTLEPRAKDVPYAQLLRDYAQRTLTRWT